MARFRFGRMARPVAVAEREKDTTTTVIYRGSFIIDSSGKAALMTSAADNLTFVGISLDESASGDTAKIRIMEARGGNCDVEVVYDLNTATSVQNGTNLQWSADRVLAASDTDPLARCSQKNSGSSAKEVHCKLKESVYFRGDAS